jgi:O-acetyl-ADP-ribose deacetylase (regulator of RNase III)
MDIFQNRLSVIEADITQLDVDAIFNAANSSLLGGGGVDGAIHRAAGPALLKECRTLGGCPTGEAKITKGYQLRARHVIHTVGPVWKGGHANEDQLLACCYRNSLTLATQHKLKTIAFPAISTGIYGFPIDRAARIAIGEIGDFLKQDPALEQIILACFGRGVYDSYLTAIKELRTGAKDESTRA